ncbi:MAG: hypothetical protein WCX65_09915 [bacterium]
MKYDPMCAACLNDCKQPSTAKLVACPHFKQASRNLDMFSMTGEVRKDLAKRMKSGAKKQRSDS